MIDSNGYTYASLADRLLDRREESPRNEEILQLRWQGYPESAVKAYWQAYDQATSQFHALRHDVGIIAFSAARYVLLKPGS